MKTYGTRISRESFQDLFVRLIHELRKVIPIAITLIIGEFVYLSVYRPPQKGKYMAAARPTIQKDYKIFAMFINVLMLEICGHDILVFSLCRCKLPPIQLLNFEVAPVLDLEVSPASEWCTVELLSCKVKLYGISFN